MSDVDDLTHYMQATSRMRERAEAAEAEVRRLREILTAMQADAENDLAHHAARASGGMAHNGRLNFGPPSAAHAVLRFTRAALDPQG